VYAVSLRKYIGAADRVQRASFLGLPTRAAAERRVGTLRTRYQHNR